MEPKYKHPYIFGYYPQIHRSVSSNINEEAKEHTLEYILGRGGVKSIVISSLIFFCVYSYIDIFAELYKRYVYKYNIFKFDHRRRFELMPPILHRANKPYKFIKPRGVKINIAEGFDFKQKVGYSISLTILTLIISFMLIKL